MIDSQVEPLVYCGSGIETPDLEQPTFQLHESDVYCGSGIETQTECLPFEFVLESDVYCGSGIETKRIHPFTTK